MAAFLVIDWATVFLVSGCIFGMSGSLLNCRNNVRLKRVAFKLWLIGDVIAILWAYATANWWFFMMYFVMTACCIYGLKDHEVEK